MSDKIMVSGYHYGEEMMKMSDELPGNLTIHTTYIPNGGRWTLDDLVEEVTKQRIKIAELEAKVKTHEDLMVDLQLLAPEIKK